VARPRHVRRGGRLGLVFATVMGAGLLAVGAAADDIANNIDPTVDAAAEVMPLVKGGTDGTTRLYVVPRNGDGKNGCNLTGSTALRVSIASSNPAVATVSPTSITFTSCVTEPAGPIVSVTPHEVGSATISVSEVANTTGATFNFAPARLTVNVAPPPNTPPQVAVAGVAGGATYAKGAVPVATCQVTDAEDGNSSFAATLGPVVGPNHLDGIGEQTASCSYTDGGGLPVEASETYGIVDPSAPAISHVLDPAFPDGNDGWYRSDVNLTWTVSEPQSPFSLSTTGCVDETITADQAEESYACSGSSAGGLAGPVVVSIKRDATPPTIAASRSVPANGAGWNNTEVTVAYECSDTLSGIDPAVGCPASQVYDANGMYTASGSTADRAGNTSSASAVVKIDRDAPVITASASTPSGPYVSGTWTNEAVTVHFECSDGGQPASGLEGSCPNDVVQASNTDVSGVDVSRSVSDVAGNAATSNVINIKVDKDAPGIQLVGRTPANANGWNNSDVSLEWSCSDDLSGPAGAGDSAFFQYEGAGQSATGHCADNAGNTASHTVLNINIDKTNPSVLASLGRGPDHNGWYNAPVVVSASGTDALSGIDTCEASPYSSPDSATASATRSCTDKAGNSASETVRFAFDDTNPTLNPTVSPNPVVLHGSATGRPGASDTTSGIDAANTGCDAVVTTSVGSKTVACHATDNAGNSASASATYSVVYDWTGFFQPIDNGDASGNYVFNKAKAGSTIPVKFSLAGDQGLSIFESGYPQSGPIACGASTTDAIEEYSTATVSGLKYDPLTNHYIYNWKTQTTWGGSCRQLIVKLVDGTYHRANFQFLR
jgi:hypothetical protein